MDINNGSQGLAGDCAACHRAHQSTATDLLKSSQPGLCLSCHNGLGATADVVDGVQYTPTGGSTYQQTTVLGALRGGGFSYALLKTDAPDRLSYNSRGGQTLTFNAAPAASTSVTLHWAAFGAFGGGDLTFDPSTSAATVQTAANTLFGVSAVYTGSTNPAYMSGLPTGGANMLVTKSTDGKTFTFATQNALRLFPVPLPSKTADTTGQNGTVADGISIGQASRVGVLASGQAVTSTHLGLGTVWGNGAQGIGTTGATGVELECTNCHNPHGNGQYRILQTLPGEDWANDTVEATTTLTGPLTAATTPFGVASAAGFPTATESAYYILVDSEKMYVTAGFGTTTWTVTRGALGTTAASHLTGASVKLITTGWTDPAVDVEVIDGPALTAGQVHNYTVKAGYTTADVAVSPTGGDYFRYKWDPSGTTNFTNFYLLKDPMNSGWNGQTPTNAAAIESIPNTTLTADISSTTATSATVASTAGFPKHTPASEPQPAVLVKIDSEILSVTVTTTGGPPATGFSATSIKISRAQYGTSAATHLSGATVQIIGTGASQDSVDYGLYNNMGRMTAYCIQCHTRYNGWAQNGTSSLNAQTPMDAIFGYKHGTTSTGCEQCHVNHGTNAVMSGVAATVLFPDGTSEDSALLKVNNRGTCQLCHDPTGTIDAGNTEGSVPGAITPQ